MSLFNEIGVWMCTGCLEKRRATSSELLLLVIASLLSLLQSAGFMHKVDKLLGCLRVLSIFLFELFFWLQLFNPWYLVNAMLLFRFRSFSIFGETDGNIAFVFSQLTEVPLSEVNWIDVLFGLKLRVEWKVEFQSLIARRI